MDQFMNNFEEYLEYFAKISAYIIEIVGIITILIGIGRVIFYIISEQKKPKLEKHNVKILLGNSLALGLEFKMGAEIIKTAITKDINDLIILGAIILLRAVLAFLIHWEIKSEKKDSMEDNEHELLKEQNKCEESSM